MSSTRSRSGGTRSRDDVEPVVQVLAERAFLDRLLEVHVGRRDEAEVGPDRPRAADALDLALLDRAQQLRLQIERADRRSRRGTACRRWPARTCRSAAACAPVNEPFSWPNSVLSTSSRGIAARLTATNGPSGRSDLTVQQPREQLLARAALAEDEHRGREPRDALHDVEHVARVRARTRDELAVRGLVDFASAAGAPAD